VTLTLFRLIGKLVVMDYVFVFALIELLPPDVTAEPLQDNIDWKSAFVKGQGGSLSAKFQV